MNKVELDEVELMLPVRSDSIIQRGEEFEKQTAQWPEKWPERWPEKWPEIARQIIDAVSRDSSISIPKLEIQTGLGHTTLKKILSEMQAENMICRVGSARGGHWEIVTRNE